jgi:hypothetical protein
MRYVALMALALVAGCVAPQTDAPPAAPVALWAESSGPRPPEYAWSFEVTFAADQQVTVEYCKGYATTEPGCAIAGAALTAEAFAALQARLGPMTADFAAHPPRGATDVLVDGEADTVTLYQDGTAVGLPTFPVEADAPRVVAAIALLKSFTPEGLVDKAKSRAR